MKYADTNILIRYLTGVPSEQAAIARQLIEEGGGPLYMTEVSFAEVCWTLDKAKDPQTGTYRYPRDLLIDQLVHVLRSTRLEVVGIDRSVLLQALRRIRSNRKVSFGDALIWARARTDGGTLYTLDQEFPSDGITVCQLNS